MSFAHPERLLFLLGWLALAPLIVRAARRRIRRWWDLGKRGLPPRAPEAAWYLVGPLLILAAAQPRWGIDPERELPPGKDVMFVVDVSRSMAARDAVPNRLAVATESALGLLAALGDEPGNRAGVIAFAGVPSLRAGLTPNLGAVAETLRRLRPGDVQPGGTDLAAAVDAAVDGFDEYDRSGGRVIVLFTDGEDHPGRWSADLDHLRETGVIVHAVSIGDDLDGRPIPVGPNETPLRFDGAIVSSRRDDRPLEALTDATGGVLLKVGVGSADLRDLYKTRIAPREARRRSQTAPDVRADRSAPFLLVALGLVVLGYFPPRPWAGRSAMFAALLLATIAAADPEDPRSLVEQGRAAFDRGDYAQAFDRFEAAARLRPLDPRIAYDTASALFRLGRYEQAAVVYQAARERMRPDDPLRLKVELCLANTLTTRGRPADAVAAYDRFIEEASTRPGWERDVEDARVNRDYARSLIKEKDETKRPDDRPEPRDREANEPEPTPNPNANRNDPGAEAGGETAKAGGAGGQQRGEGSETAEQRLKRAVESIRRAERNALPDEPNASTASGGVKDW